MTSTESMLTHNQPEYSVSELAGAVKRSIETEFGYVRVRGEISGFKRAASGHCYMDLKDDKAALNAVCWKGQAVKLEMQPQDGLEVIATGRMTTYPGRSNYQLVIERMEIAGEGALMALLEKRKKALAAEGLFDPQRKQLLPYLPKVIGVVTSPTGAVIRDILHRLAERFPVHVLVWPTIVQGKGAENTIAAAIDGFNRFDGITTPPRPDVLIIARGGGSIEDLWCFNEEIVVRAAARSAIALISAVGHETDTTLIDYVSDKRAPTPTAAAEMAVPVIADLRYTLGDAQNRLQRTALRSLEQRKSALEGLARGLVNPRTTLENNTQRFDEWHERLHLSWQRLETRLTERLSEQSHRLHPTRLMLQCRQLQDRLNELSSRTQVVMQNRASNHVQKLDVMDARLQAAARLQERLMRYNERLAQVHNKLDTLLSLRLHKSHTSLETYKRMLEALGHHNILKRGFAYVTSAQGAAITQLSQLENIMTLHLQDGNATIYKDASRASKKPLKAPRANMQGSLL